MSALSRVVAAAIAALSLPVLAAAPTFSASVSFNEQAWCADMAQCQCPRDANWITCVRDITVSFTPDSADVGGRGYFAAVVESAELGISAILDKNGRWVNRHARGRQMEFSYRLDPLSNRHAFRLPLPGREEILRLCPANWSSDDNRPAPKIDLYLGYGAVSKEHIERMERLKRVSAETLDPATIREKFGNLDEHIEGAAIADARADARRNSALKTAKVYTFSCPPPQAPTTY